MSDEPKWNTAYARRNFAELVDQVHDAPQTIYNRERKVAVMVDPQTWERFQAWERQMAGASIGQAFAELLTLVEDDDYEAKGPLIAAPERVDRDNPWA